MIHSSPFTVQQPRRLLQRSIPWVKFARFILFDAPFYVLVLLLLLGVLFRRAFLLEIDQKLAAAQFDQFVRGERIHEPPDPSISYPINYQPFDILLLLPSGVDPRDQAIRKCDPIPYPPSYRPRSTACILLPPSFSVLRPLTSTVLEPPSRPIHTLSDASTFLRVQILKGSCIIVVGLVLLGETGVCLNPLTMAVSLVIIPIRRNIFICGCFALFVVVEEKFI
jgi:hypothetical protein